MAAQIRDPDELRRHRESKGLSQRRLARLIGCSQTAIYHVETRGKPCTDRLAAQIAGHVGVPVHDLFDTDSGEQVA